MASFCSFSFSSATSAFSILVGQTALFSGTPANVGSDLTDRDLPDKRFFFSFLKSVFGDCFVSRVGSAWRKAAVCTFC